jgi:predicted P-loop ATPase/GTPase
MKLLVAGAKRVDAGKTTVATGLVDHTGAVGFKPRAGNDYWFDHDDCLKAIAEGRLYGKDARRLAAASPGAFEPEDLNPIHRLWTPSPGPGTGLLGQADREFVVDRVGDTYVRNGTVEVPDPVAAGLPLEDAAVVNSVEALNDVTEARHLPAQRTLLETIRRTDRAVVESYGDVARPLTDFEPDAVVVVEPRRLRLFDGTRYANACEVAPGGQREGTLEQRVDAVVDMLDPAHERAVEPLPAEQRTDPAAVASAYEDAFDALLELAAPPDTA